MAARDYQASAFRRLRDGAAARIEHDDGAGVVFSVVRTAGGGVEMRTEGGERRQMREWPRAVSAPETPLPSSSPRASGFFCMLAPDYVDPDNYGQQESKYSDRDTTSDEEDTGGSDTDATAEVVYSEADDDDGDENVFDQELECVICFETPSARDPLDGEYYCSQCFCPR